MKTDHALISESYHPEQYRKLAIKCIKKAFHDPAVVEAERSILCSLSHPHHVAIVDQIDLPDFRFLPIPLATSTTTSRTTTSMRCRAAVSSKRLPTFEAKGSEAGESATH
jgi:hypothetical protein